MQAVPYTAFTTKSVQYGNSVNSPQHSRDGTRNQSPVGHPAFNETFHRATEDVSKPTANTTGARLRGHTMHGHGNIRSDGMGSNIKNISVQTATAGNNPAATPLSPETAGNVLQQLLAILQMLGLAGESEVTSDLPQTPTQADLLKALPGQNQNLNETLGQLQKDLQQLVQQLRQLIEKGSTLADARLFLAGNDLWKTFNLADSDVLSNREFLVRLAEELGKIVAKTSANAGKNPDIAYVVTVSKTNDSGRIPADNLMAKNPAGDYLFTFKAGASDVSSQNGEGSRAADGQIPIKIQNVDGSGIAGTSSGSGETKQAETQKNDFPQAQSGQIMPLKVDVGANDSKQSDSKLIKINQAESRQVGINQTEVKPTEAQQSELKQSEVKPTEVKQNEVKQTDVKQTDVKQADVKQADVKQADVKQADVKQAEVKHTEGISDNRLFGFKGANTAPANSGQSGLGLQDQNNPLPQANPDHSQVQSFKLPEQPVNIPRMAQVIFGQITQKAKLLVTPGTTEMQIQLKPDYLGKMNLSITTENGLVTAKFNTESYRVKEVIEANLNTLKDSLAQQGVKVDQLVVNVSTDKDYSENQEKNNLYYNNNSGRSNKTDGKFKEEELARLFPADLESKSIQAYYGNTVDFKA